VPAAGPLLVVLTGPSGAGKDSVLARLKSLRRPYHFAVTATTRPPRENERDGVDYFFVSPSRFQEMLDRGELLENAVVYGFRYGVPRTPIRRALAAGKDVIFRADVQGARYIKSVAPGATTVFVTVPSEGELDRRLRARGTDSPEQLELRLRTAKSEMASAGEFDHTVVNDDLDRCVAEVEWILEGERRRPGRAPVVV
jgi:guanylate kinase